MEKLIKKLNNIEENIGWVERYFHLDGKVWFVGHYEMFVDGHRASKKEIKKFLEFKKMVEGLKIVKVDTKDLEWLFKQSRTWWCNTLGKDVYNIEKLSRLEEKYGKNKH